MRETTETYKEIVSGDYIVETRISTNKEPASSGVPENEIIEIRTKRRLFPDSYPSIGNCVSGEIKASFFVNGKNIPRNAEIRIYTRVKSLDGSLVDSKWIRKGTFFIDTRKYNHWENGKKIITITGFDAMLRAEQEYDVSTLKEWPAKDVNIVKKIANQIGVEIDERTLNLLENGYGYRLNTPFGYSCREVLGYIAGMYGGNFIISDIGELLLVQLNNVPRNNIYLVNEDGAPITFGGVSIIV